MSDPDGTEEQAIDRTCRREPDPHYGLADRVAIALFPFLGGTAAAAGKEADKEAGQ